MPAPTFNAVSILEDSASFWEGTFTWDGTSDLLFPFNSWCPTGAGFVRINPAGANVSCTRTQVQVGATDWNAFFYVSAATLLAAGVTAGTITARAEHEDGGDYGIILRRYEVNGATYVTILQESATGAASISESGIPEPDNCLAIQSLYTPKTSGVAATASNSQTTQWSVDYDGTRQVHATRAFGDVSGSQSLGWSLSPSSNAVLLTALFYETAPAIPELVALTPADNATDVDVNTNLELEFDVNVASGIGNVTVFEKIAPTNDPTVELRTTVSSGTADVGNFAISWTIPGGSYQEGDIVEIVIQKDDDNAFTAEAPTDWTLSYAQASSTTTRQMSIWRRFASGATTNSVTVSESGGTNESFVARVLLIRGAHLTTAPYAPTPVTGTSTAADPPSVTFPWGTEPTFCFAVCGGDGNGSASAYPTSATNTGTDHSGHTTTTSRVWLAWGEFENVTAGSLNPSAFTNTNEEWVANTICFRPADPSVLIEVIDITDTGQVTFSTDTVTVELTDPLDPETEYYVTVDSGAIENASDGAPYGGISGNTAWTFTTAAASSAHEFDGVNVESATEVGSGTLTQNRAFAGTSVECAVNVDSGALTQNRVFSGVDVESTTEVGSGALTYAYNFTGVNNECATEVGSGELVNRHNFAGIGNEAATEVASPELVNKHLFSGSQVESATEVGSPSLTQNRVFVGVGVESATEVGSGALTNIHLFAGSNVESVNEVGSPALTNRHRFSGSQVESATEVDSSTLTNIHKFVGVNVESAAEVGTPELSYGSDFGGVSVECATEVGTPALTQNRAFAGVGVESATETGTGALRQTNLFVGSSIESASEVGSGALTRRVVFGATGVESATEVANGSLTQVNLFTGQQIEALTEVGTPELEYDSGSELFGGISVECATEVGTVALIRRVQFAGSSAESTTEVGSPALRQGNLLAGVNVESNTEVGIANLLQRFIFNGLGAESACEVQSVGLTQVRLFSGQGNSSATEVGSGSLAYQGYNEFSGVSVECLSQVGTPALTYNNPNLIPVYPISNRFDSMIELARRLISQFGQTVTWRALTNVVNETQPWKSVSTNSVNHKVDIAFLPLDRDAKEYIRSVKKTEVLTGFVRGYMGAVDFDVSPKDVVIRNGKELRIEAIDQINSNGQIVLNKILFRE